MLSGQIVYLASASPRRREILKNLGFMVKVLPIDIDETVKPGECAEQYVRRMAETKNQAAVLLYPELPYPIISADTSVVAPDGEILGKPRDAADAERMLCTLSGRIHRVLSAVTVSCGQKSNTLISESMVTFAVLSLAEIKAYLACKESFDKAGGYGIQGWGGTFVAHLSGSFSGVMGLPIFETVTLLKQYL